MGFVLGLFQIAMQESLVSVIKGGLRAVAAAARQHAGQEQKRQANDYPGPLCPLAMAVGPVTVPPPMQPRCMFSMFRVK